MNNKKISTLVGIIIIVAVATVVFGWVLAYQHFSAPKINNIKATSTNQTTDLQTYTNIKYGFEAKYPNGYSEFNSSSDSYIDFRTTKECEPLLNRGGGEWPVDCQDYNISIQKDKMVTSGTGIDMSQITVAEIQGEKITATTGMWNNMTQVVVQFQKDSDWYVQTFTFNTNKSQLAESVMNQILASFKFVK